MSLIYTGIGSRKTPDGILEVMEEVAFNLANAGWTLYSGGAPGADVAFERGCDRVDGPKRIFLPWSTFNIEGRSKLNRKFDESELSTTAERMAADFHPSWDFLKAPARKLHTRNVCQIFGDELDEPDTKLVICWTEGGNGNGGTGQALRIARHFQIPIVDFGTYMNLSNATREISKITQTR